MRSDVIGDFQEPYGAIFGECDKLTLCSLTFSVGNLSVSRVVKLWKTFSYTLAKALQALCNLRFNLGG
jgi:hypothetical protein